MCLLAASTIFLPLPACFSAQGAEGNITAIARPEALPKDGLNSATHHHLAILKGPSVQLFDLRMLKWPLLIWPFVRNAFDMPYHQYQGVESSENGVSYFNRDIKLSLRPSSRECRPTHLIHTLPTSSHGWHPTQDFDNSGAIICGMKHIDPKRPSVQQGEVEMEHTCNSDSLRNHAGGSNIHSFSLMRYQCTSSAPRNALNTCLGIGPFCQSVGLPIHVRKSFREKWHRSLEKESLGNPDTIKDPHSLGPEVRCMATKYGKPSHTLPTSIDVKVV